MKTFKTHLNEKLTDEEFRHLYEEERQLAELSLKIAAVRQQLGVSQKEVAKRASVSQQQLSRIENGLNCNMSTFLKVCHALDLTVDVAPASLDLR